MAVATVVTGAFYIFKIGALPARRLALLWQRAHTVDAIKMSA